MYIKNCNGAEAQSDFIFLCNEIDSELKPRLYVVVDGNIRKQSCKTDIDGICGWYPCLPVDEDILSLNKDIHCFGCTLL